MKHIESVLKIYFSREYGNFSFLPGNRDLNPSKVEKIKKDIKNGLDILRYAPIIVNEELQIIDGQHRFCVARDLKENVHYVINKDLTLSHTTKINSRASSWRNIDFLNSYIDLKKQSYLDLKELLDEYPKLSLSTAFKMIHAGNVQGPEIKECVESFRDGELKSEFKELTYELCGMLKSFEPFVENPYSSRFFLVILSLHDNGVYDHKKMVQKLHESGRRIEDIQNMKSITANLESIINHRSRQRILIH